MSFNYEQAVWGRGPARLRWSNPAAFRLRAAIRAIRSVPAGGRVLEVGCGAGQFIRAIKYIRPELDCAGCDISGEAIRAARAQGGGVAYDEVKNSRLPYSDDYFAAVLIFDVLEHVPDPGVLLHEVRRVLAPQGVLQAFVPCEGDATSLWHWLDRLGLKRDLTKKFAGHINYFSRQSLNSLFAPHQWRLLSLRYSEHLIGQLLGVIIFALMARSARASSVPPPNNEAYCAAWGNGRLVTVGKRIVNSLVYLESRLLCRVPSPNVHLTVQKLA